MKKNVRNENISSEKMYLHGGRRTRNSDGFVCLH